MSNITDKIRDLLSADDDFVHYSRGIHEGVEDLIALSHKQVLFLPVKGVLRYATLRV